MNTNQHQNQSRRMRDHHNRRTLIRGGARAYEGKRTSIKRTFLGKHEWKGWVHYRGSRGTMPITAGAWARWAGDEAP